MLQRISNKRSESYLLVDVLFPMIYCTAQFTIHFKSPRSLRPYRPSSRDQNTLATPLAVTIGTLAIDAPPHQKVASPCQHHDLCCNVTSSQLLLVDSWSSLSHSQNFEVMV